jgi:hypothetical protein
LQNINPPESLMTRFVSIMAVLLAGSTALQAQAPGRATLPASCAAAARQAFDRGLASLRTRAWEEAANAFREAATVEPRCHHPGQPGPTEYLVHAYDHLVHAYLNKGHDRQTLAIVGEIEALDSVFAGGSISAGYSRAAIPVRFALERNDWGRAAELPVHPTPGFAPAEALTRYARGLGAVRMGDTAAAKAERAGIAAVESALGPSGGSWTGLARAQGLQVDAWITLARGDTAGAVRIATGAADIEDGLDSIPGIPGHSLPAREVLADLLLAAGMIGDAWREYEAVLAREPGRARSVYGAARTAEQTGRIAAARTRIQEYMNLMREGDRGR